MWVMTEFEGFCLDNDIGTKWLPHSRKIVDLILNYAAGTSLWRVSWRDSSPGSFKLLCLVEQPLEGL